MQDQSCILFYWGSQANFGSLKHILLPWWSQSLTLPLLALFQRQLRKAREEEQVFSELHSSWGTDNYVWVRKNWPPQMAIYEQLRLVGPAHTASNWMVYNLCEEQLQRFKYLTAKGARVEIFSLFCSKVGHKCPTGRGSPWTTAKDLLVLTVGWRALGSCFTFGQGACCPH